MTTVPNVLTGRYAAVSVGSKQTIKGMYMQVNCSICKKTLLTEPLEPIPGAFYICEECLKKPNDRSKESAIETQNLISFKARRFGDCYESKPYICPVCYGRGQVPSSFYNPRVKETTANSDYQKCKSCGGTGIVWS